MADSIPPIVRQIVGKLHVGTPEDEVVDHFWSKVKNRGMDMSEKDRERFERHVRKCHQENLKLAGRMALGFLEA